MKRKTNNEVVKYFVIFSVHYQNIHIVKYENVMSLTSQIVKYENVMSLTSQMVMYVNVMSLNLNLQENEKDLIITFLYKFRNKISKIIFLNLPNSFFSFYFFYF
jgi:hypothetical protein